MTGIKAAIASFLLICGMGNSAPNVTTSYPVPLEAEVQTAIIEVCKDYEIDPAVIFAMMDVESDYNADALGDGGKAFGILQVWPWWHGERMNRLSCTDLYDPVQCVTVAVDYLAELLDKYEGDMSKALVAYNAGPSGAQEHYFSCGIYESDYSREVLMIAQSLTEGVTTNVCP